MLKYFLLIIFYVGVICSPAQVILSEIMFYPDTLSNYTEYIEIYNLSDSSVDLSNWSVGDENELDLLMPVDQGLIIQPHQFAIILDPGYFDHADIYDPLPGEALIITIDDGSIGQNGLLNNAPEMVILKNAAGDTVQRFAYIADNFPGYSEEKIDLNGDNSSQNWGNSRVFRGTPGRINSISPRDFDVKIDRVSLWLVQPGIGNELSYQVWIVNSGLNSIDTFKLTIFADLNQNSQADHNEILAIEQFDQELSPSDTFTYQGNFINNNTGYLRFGFQISNALDQDSSNNLLFIEKYLPQPHLRLAINEIMFSPSIVSSEWIEVCNFGDVEVDLKNWILADMRDSTLITQSSKIISPHDYLVLGPDSQIIEKYQMQAEKFHLVKNFPILNNDFDEIKVLEPDSSLHDIIPYTQDWFGREVEKGVSLEKINPSFNGKSSSNWGASVDPQGATPGRQNSIYIEKPEKNASLTIHPNPFSPDSDGNEDFTTIYLQIPAPTAFVQIKIYDLRGRIVRNLVDAKPIGQEAIFVWDGKDDDGRVARIGVYICLVKILNANRNLLKELKNVIVLTKNE